MSNSANTFGTGRKFFHWVIAGVLLIQIPLAWYMVDLPLAEKAGPYNLHKSIGIVLLALGVARLIWALFSKRPKLVAPWYEKALSKVSQAVLYLLICLMPLSGWIMSSAAGFPPKIFGLVQLPPLMAADESRVEGFVQMHEIQSYILLTALALHLIGAIRHHFLLKDDVVKRMLPGG